MNILELAIAIGLGFVFHDLFWHLINMPRTMARNRRRREMAESIQKASQEVINYMERTRHDEAKGKPTVQRKRTRPTGKKPNSKVRSGTKATSKKASNKSR